MATWVPAPSTVAQSAGGLTPMSGKFVNGEAIGTVMQQPPSPPFIGAPKASTLVNLTQGVAI
jgi:hypothetical protein